MQSTLLSLQRLSPWVGLRKINVSYWAWEDMSPFTNTSLRWLPGEPSDSGFCAYLERAQVAGLKANPCTSTTDGLICEKPTGKTEWTECKRRSLQLRKDTTISIVWPFVFSRSKESECSPLQDPLLSAHQLCQLHQPAYGVYVVQQYSALCWLLSVRHLLPLRPVFGVADPGLHWWDIIANVGVSSQPKDDAFGAYELLLDGCQWFIVYEILFNKTNVEVFRHNMERKVYSCDTQKQRLQKKKKHHWLLVS